MLDDGWTRISAFLALALIAVGCGDMSEERGVGPGGDASVSGDGGIDPLDATPAPSCAEMMLETLEMLSNSCVRCHAEDGSGGANIDDVEALIASGRVVPGDAAASPLFRRIASGTMPPAGETPRPTGAQVAAVEAWVNCGAPALIDSGWRVPFNPSTDWVMDEIADDLRRFDNRAQRQSLRYILLTHRAAAGAMPGELSQLRDAVDVLVNHLPRGSLVMSPVVIDRERTILRIDLDDYAWDASTWDQLVANYPYFVQYDDASVEFPFDEATQQFIQQETSEEIPWIYADWFVANASQPPLYYLEPDRSLRDLAAALWLEPNRVRDAVLTDVTLSTAFGVLATRDGRVTREVVEAEFGNLVCAIGVGRPVCSDATTHASCGCIDPR